MANEHRGSPGTWEFPSSPLEHESARAGRTQTVQAIEFSVRDSMERRTGAHWCSCGFWRGIGFAGSGRGRRFEVQRDYGILQNERSHSEKLFASPNFICLIGSRFLLCWTFDFPICSASCFQEGMQVGAIHRARRRFDPDRIVSLAVSDEVK